MIALYFLCVAFVVVLAFIPLGWWFALKLFRLSESRMTVDDIVGVFTVFTIIMFITEVTISYHILRIAEGL